MSVPIEYMHRNHGSGYLIRTYTIEEHAGVMDLAALHFSANEYDLSPWDRQHNWVLFVFEKGVHKKARFRNFKANVLTLLE